MYAANGDALYLEIAEGEILPSTMDGYVYMFMDPFEFTGGTGRFEGVSGSGTTNSFVKNDPEKTDHNWKGSLVIPR